MAISIAHAHAVKTKTWPLPLIIAWLIWRRNRIGICVAAAGCIVGSILAHTLLAGSLSSLNGTQITLMTFFRPRTSGGNSISGTVLMWTLELAFFYMQYICFIALRVSWIWSFDRTKVALYPPHLLRAPASTIGLAIWPILCGIFMAASYWLFNVEMVFRPMGYSVTFTGTALGLSLMVALYAAANWTRLSPILQSVILLCFLCSIVFTVETFTVPFGTTGYLCAFAFVCASIGVAVKGLGWLRCSVMQSWEWPSSLSWIKNLQERKIEPQTSPFAAFVHVDQGGTRSTSLVGWVMMGVMALILPAFIDAFCQAVIGSSAANSMIELDGSLGMVAFTLVIFGITPAIARVLPGIAGSEHYILSRPLSTQTIAAAKLWSVICEASRSALAIVIVLAFSAAWQLYKLTAHNLTHHPGIGNAHAEIEKITSTCAVLSIIAVYRWSINVSSSAQASNKFWSLVALIIDYIGSSVFFVIAWILSGYTHSDAEVFVCSVAMVKLIAGMVSVQTLVRSGLIDRHGLVIAAVSWVVAAGLVYVALLFVLPNNLSDPPALCALTLIAMPLVRLSLGPILLDRNRHR